MQVIAIYNVCPIKHTSKIKLKRRLYLNTDTKISLLKSKKTSTLFSSLKNNHLKQKHTNKTMTFMLKLLGS